MQKVGVLHIMGLVRVLDDDKMLNPSYYVQFHLFLQVHVGQIKQHSGPYLVAHLCTIMKLKAAFLLRSYLRTAGFKEGGGGLHVYQHCGVFLFCFFFPLNVGQRICILWGVEYSVPL